jgi:hypothetical protein
MAANSFFLKAWAVTLVAALFVLAGKDATRGFLLIAYLPAAAFWGLDGYYLHKEKLFRKLYDSVRLLEEGDIDFSMAVGQFGDRSNSWINCALSRTLFAFYGTIITALTIVMFAGF